MNFIQILRVLKVLKNLIDFNPNGFYVDSDANNGGAGTLPVKLIFLWQLEMEKRILLLLNQLHQEQYQHLQVIRLLYQMYLVHGQIRMKIRGATTDSMDYPDPIDIYTATFTSSEPVVTAGVVNSWTNANAEWELAHDLLFAGAVQTKGDFQ